MKDDVTIGNLAVEAPVRKYRIEMILRQKPSLEAPAEACLRALMVAERLSEAGLAQYLGLALEEFDVIASELIGQFLVRRSGPDLVLTSKGKEAIDPNAEGQKREKRTATLSFEDSAFAEVPRSRPKPWMRRMNPREIREDGRPEAAAAFREGFVAWRAREREGKHGDVLSRVTNVTPLGRDSAVIKAPVVLAPASNAAYIDVSRIELGSLASAARREICAERFRETVTSALAPQDGAAAIEWIINNIGPIAGAPALDPVGWARRTRLGEIPTPSDTLVVSETAPSFLARDGQKNEFNPLAADISASDSDAEFPEVGVVLWSPPEGETWRLDADIDRAALGLSREIRMEDDEERSLVTGVFRHRRGEERDIEMDWRIENGAGPFNIALLASSISNRDAPLATGVGEILPQALELVVRPRCWALAIAHVATERSPIPVPVGVFTKAPEAIERVTRVFIEKIEAAAKCDWRAPGGVKGLARSTKKLEVELRL